MSRRCLSGRNSDLSLTPMIDVMMVLLAVFMVTTPLLTSGLDLDLPKAGHGAVSGDEHAVQLSVDANGAYYLGKTKMSAQSIVKKLYAMQNENSKLSIMINGDQSASYGDVIILMGTLKDAGFSKVGLRTRLPN